MAEDDVRWLDTDERQAWLALAMVSMRLPAVLDAQLQRDSGMSFYEYMTMSVLSEQPDRTLPMSSIAAMTASTLARLSHVARRLEDRGWLRRRPDPEDGRTTLASLTELGWETVVAAAPGHVRQARELIVDRMTREQVQQLRRIGDRLTPGLWPEGVPRPPV